MNDSKAEPKTEQPKGKNAWCGFRPFIWAYNKVEQSYAACILGGCAFGGIVSLIGSVIVALIMIIVALVAAMVAVNAIAAIVTVIIAAIIAIIGCCAAGIYAIPLGATYYFLQYKPQESQWLIYLLTCIIWTAFALMITDKIRFKEPTKKKQTKTQCPTDFNASDN